MDLQNGGKSKVIPVDPKFECSYDDIMSYYLRQGDPIQNTRNTPRTSQTHIVLVPHLEHIPHGNFICPAGLFMWNDYCRGNNETHPTR